MDKVQVAIAAIVLCTLANLATAQSYGQATEPLNSAAATRDR